MYTVANLQEGLKAALAVSALCSAASLAADGDHAEGFLCGEDCTPEQTCRICHYCQRRSERGQEPIWDSMVGSELRVGYARHGEEGRLAGMSLFCLSCHDGATASNPTDSSGRFGVAGTIGIQPDRQAGHHPFYVNYDGRAESELKPSVDRRVRPLPLYGYPDSADRLAHVECPTCHAAHNAPADHLLRVTDDREKLCLICHGASPRREDNVLAQVSSGGHDSDGADCMDCHRK